MFVVSLIAHYMAYPKEEHMLIAKRVLMYLKGTLDFGIFYGKLLIMKLVGYTDSDYARDSDDRKSTSGYAFLMNRAAICWSRGSMILLLFRQWRHNMLQRVLRHVIVFG